MTAIIGACFFLGILYIFEVIAPRVEAENKIQLLKELQNTIQILKVSGLIGKNSATNLKRKHRHKQVSTHKKGKSA